MFNLRVLCRDQPRRTIALLASDHVLIFHYSEVEGGPKAAPRCRVEFLEASSVDLAGYRSLGAGYGTLGLVTLNEDVFVCVVTGSSQAATVRPAEAVARIDNVDFCMLLINIYTLIYFPLSRLTHAQIVSTDPNMNMAWTTKPAPNSPPMIGLVQMAKRWSPIILSWP